MNNCCVLGHAPYSDKRVLHESDNFFICAGLGAMGVEGYLMVVSKEHWEGSGELPKSMRRELDDLIYLTKARVHEVYGKGAIAFEHGLRVGECGGGGCIDHLHIQIFPGVDIRKRFAVSLIDCLKEKDKFYRVDRVEGFERTAVFLTKEKLLM